MKAKPVIQVRVQSQALAKSWPRLTEDERDFLTEMHQHWEGEFKRIDWVARGNREGIAATEHSVVDEHMREFMATHPKAPEVPCRRGCSACCRQNVTITEPEGVLLLKFAEYAGVVIDWAKVERQAAAPGRGPKAWSTLPVEDRACVFLGDDGECRVYEHRPSGCRKYLVFTDAALCDVEKHPGEQVGILFSLEAETVASASLVVFDNGPLPRMLLQAKAKETTK
ncbi:MAG TPA: YkgJ family cysteine cluster protein [Mycobacterium sp.]|nr:YkgJ family cysteine cluster protein [Mycobacterium sp.]